MGHRDVERSAGELPGIDPGAPGFADLYDELPLWSAPFGLALLDRVPLGRGLTILDVGAGTGFLAIELAERCGADTRVIAVDPWHGAMERLRRKAAQRGLTNIELLEQDACGLGLPGASVDVVVSNLGIHNFADPAAVLAECFRVARPGAALLLATNLAGHMAEFYEVYRGVLTELGQHDRLAVLDEHVRHRGTVESVSGLLARAGFDVVDIVPGAFRLRFADGSALLRHHFVRLGFVPDWKEIASPGSVGPTFDRLEQRLNDLARPSGELALTIPMACFEGRKPPVAR